MAGSFNQERQAHQEIVMPLSRVNIEIDGLAGAVLAFCPFHLEPELLKFIRAVSPVHLQPANSRMRPLYVEPENVEIQGRVIGVIRGIA